MFTVQLNKRLKELKGSKDDFGGVSIITIGDLFQLKPVMDGYVFTDIPCLNSCNILAPNLWRRYFKMLELDLIMHQRERKMFAEILNRLYEADLGKTKSAQVVRIQFPLRPALTKTVHRSQGDTHYKSLLIQSQEEPSLTYISSLYFCESKISVDPNAKEMELLRNEYKLDLCFTPLYMLETTDLKICFII